MLSIEYEGVVYTPKIASDFAFGDVPLWSRLMIGDPDGSESGQCLYFSRFDVISKYDDTFVINWKPICKSDYVWFQIDCISIPDTITNNGISENDIVPEEKIDTINTGEELVPNKLYTPANASSGLSPIMKYVGGKTKEMKYILPSLPSYENYYEPFVGGGSVYMGINANEYYINDLSSDLISLYQCIFSSDEQFFKYMDSIDQSWERANDFSVTNQERLTNLYFSYLNGKISNDDFQFEVALFCEEKEYDILKIVKDSGM